LWAFIDQQFESNKTWETKISKEALRQKITNTLSVFNEEERNALRASMANTTFSEVMEGVLLLDENTLREQCRSALLTVNS
jgi:hypothetical protein